MMIEMTDRKFVLECFEKYFPGDLDAAGNSKAGRGAA